MEHNHHIYQERLKNDRFAGKGLAFAAGLTLVIFFVELIGGFVSGSLALVADAGHMATDVFALGISFIAVRFTQKPATPQRTYGFYRVEILAAFVNGLLLCLVSVYICIEAYQRFFNPQEIHTGEMLIYGAIGFAANVFSAVALRGTASHSVNVKAAYLHVMSDLLGSIGVIVAAGVIWLTGWTPIDPILSVILSLLIVRSAWGVITESVDILLESAPRGLDPKAVDAAMRQMPHVMDLHDLHIWSITSGVNALSCHILIDEYSCSQELIVGINTMLKARFEIEHVTVQLETQGVQDEMQHPAVICIDGKRKPVHNH